MKKFYLLMMLFITSTVMGQTPIITMILDGDCPGGNPKVLEIYAQGTVDFTNYSLENQTNANTTWGNTYDLTPLGTVTDEFVYLHSDDPSFAIEFPTVTNTHSVSSSVISFNGDDRVRIVETATGTLVDQFGTDGVSGTGLAWEYKDGFAKRNNNTGPDGLFVEANWTFSNGGVDNLCGTTTFETISNAGSYTSASGPAIATSASTLTGFLQFVGTPSAEQTVDVSGTNLTADIVVTVNSGDYEISTTTGTGFGATVTLPFGTGTVTATPIYVRLNGTVIANPSDGDLLITSVGATDATVMLEGEIAAPAPTVTVSKTAISGFSHFVGTPSIADSFMVSGFNLTDDVIVTAPTNFEVSTTIGGTYSSTVTLTNMAGAVASTKVYVRLDGPILNLTQAGDVVVSTLGASDKIVALDGETLDYVITSIGAVTGVDANGEGTSVGDYVTLTGVLHCDDFRGSGYDLTMIDANNDGINVFSFTDIGTYTPVEGDEIEVSGQIAQFNGLLQINPDMITVISQGAALQTPTVVTVLDESTESQMIELLNLTLVNGEANWPDHGNIDVTNGVDTFLVRVPGISPIADTPTPSGTFSLIGIGKQYDSSSPFTSGYQMFPCSVTPECNINTATTLVGVTITALETSSSATFQWFDCDDNTNISGANGQTFTATENGNYAVIITDGACTDTSDCVLIDDVSVTTNEFEGVSVYPNPVADVLNITNENGLLQSVEVVSTTGAVVYSSAVSSSNFTVNTSKLNAGVYFVNVRTANSVKTFKVIK